MDSLLLTLTGITRESGYCYTCSLPQELEPGDSSDEPTRSIAELFENGRSIGPAHTLHENIRRHGNGAFSHWQNQIYFSATDNTDPSVNGRAYQIYLPGGQVSKRRRAHDLANLVSNNLSGQDAYSLAEAFFYELVPNGFIGDWGKSCWDDRSFLDDFHRLVPYSKRSFERKYVVHQLVRSLKSVSGDMAECGVYNGATAYFMAHGSRLSGMPRRLHLFDSFKGLSQPGAVDGDYWHAGDLAIAEDVVRRNLADFDNMHIHNGWIPTRFGEVEDKQFAFVHIDVDLYQPTRDSLAFFYPRLVRGGMIVFDDYGFTTCPGAWKAVEEYMADKPEHVIHLPTGQGFVLRR